MPPKSNSAVVKKKLSFYLGESKNCTILMGFYIEEGINPKDAAFARYGG